MSARQCNFTQMSALAGPETIENGFEAINEVIEKSSGPEISISAEPIFHIGSFAVTNAQILSVTAFLLFVIVALIIRRKISMIPRGIQNVMEWFMDFMLELMESILGNRQRAEQYFPLIGTVFLFVMFGHWLSLLPGVGSIGITEIHNGESIFVPLFRSPGADLNFTIALAIISVFATNFLGMKVLGIKGHLGKFFTFKKPFPIFSFVGILELLSEFIKIVSFSFRMFGNLFAGEVLLIIISFLVGYVVPMPFLALEMFVGMIQAFIFSMLTLVFIGMAITSHEEAH